MYSVRIGPLRFPETPFLDIEQGEWEALVEALEQATFGLKAFARRCRGPGSAVLVSSAAAARAIHGCTLEAVAGAFLTTVSLVAAVELKPRGIAVNTIVPARPPDEKTVAAVAGFLTSGAAAGVTGAVIAADGGFSVTKEPGAKPPLAEPG